MSRNPIPNPIPPRVPPRGVAPVQSGAVRVQASPAAPKAQPMTPGPAPLPQPRGPQGEVVARAATYYRMTRYIMVLLLLGVGGWFGYDGFKGWPADNAGIADLNKQLDAAKNSGDAKAQEEINNNKLTHQPPHSDTDILFQKVLAFGLPALGLFILVWALYHSRGAYRLVDDMLSVPGHPPLKLAQITEIDTALWDRKGIARISYKTVSGASGRLKLDDFIYQRDPTDEIFKRIENHVTGGMPERSAGPVA